MKPSILQKFTTNLRESLKNSLKLALELSQPEITPLHLLYGLALQKGSVASEILGKIAVEKDKIQSHLGAPPPISGESEPVLSQEAGKILERAAILASGSGHRYVGTEHLLSAILESKDRGLDDFWGRDKKKKENIKIHLGDVLKSVRHFPEMVSLIGPPIGEANLSAGQAGMPYGEEGVGPATDLAAPLGQPRGNPILEFFANDLTAAAALRKMDPLVGRARELERLVQILCRRRKNNPVLLGEPGVGKTAIVEGLAQKIAAGEVPDELQGRKILQLDLGLLIAGTIYRGEFESRLKQLLDEIKKDPEIILFIDEIHTIVGAGSAAGTLDAANILKPALARGEIRCIGATTYEEYKKSIESDAALERRLQPVIVGEPTREETIAILDGLAKNYEKYHHLKFSREAILAAVALAERFLPQKFFPDKAIDLLDEAAAAKKLTFKASRELRELKAKERDLRVLAEEKRAAVLAEEFERAMRLKDDENKLLEEATALKNKLAKKRRPGGAVLETADVAKVISQIVGLPAANVLNSLAGAGGLNLEGEERERMLGLETKLAEKIVGQEEVLRAVARTLRRAKLGLASPRRPLASFIFVGPTGVGKTELAKVLANELFPSGRGAESENFIRIDMSEFSESFHVTKLVGAPAGYVGYKEGNKLADKIKHHPYSVILFDEIDKAHPDVFNLFLQILDEGHLTDAVGKRINFKNTVIILTTNLGEEFFTKGSLGFGGSGDEGAMGEAAFVEAKKNAVAELKNRFRAEFLNRLDQILVFRPLGLADLEKIVELKTIEFNSRLAGKNIFLELSVDARRFLAEEAKKLAQGARAIDKVMRDYVEEPLVGLILAEKNSGRLEMEIQFANHQIKFKNKWPT